MSARSLYEKLCREQSQAEESTALHPAREARRLGDGPPAAAFRALAADAEQRAPAFAQALGDQPGGRAIGRAVGKLFSATRQLVADRLIDAERSYRGTLLGIKHGLDCARLLQRVAERVGERATAEWCARMIAERAPLVAAAEDALAWFSANA